MRSKVIIKKFVYRIKTQGFVNTLLYIFEYPMLRLRRVSVENQLKNFQQIEDRFTEIYEQNYWGSRESRSGNGSTLKYTTRLRDQLPTLIDKFGIKTVFDAPCGDFNWMSSVLNDLKVKYIGGDIVKPLIDELKSKHGEENVTFIHIDLTSESYPPADLMINRDCLFHLSFSDTRKLLKNYLESNIPYFLSSTFQTPEEFRNQDIQSGDFRIIDLFREPYSFPREILFKIVEEERDLMPTPELCLWRREQIERIYANFS